MQVTPCVRTSAVAGRNQVNISLMERISRSIPSTWRSPFQVQPANDSEHFVSSGEPGDQIERVRNTGMSATGQHHDTLGCFDEECLVVG